MRYNEVAMKLIECRECKKLFAKRFKTLKDPKFCSTDCYMVILKRKVPKEELIIEDTAAVEDLSVKYLLFIVLLIVAMGIFVVIMGK
jgi:hypothetical protein